MRVRDAFEDVTETLKPEELTPAFVDTLSGKILEQLKDIFNNGSCPTGETVKFQAVETIVTQTYVNFQYCMWSICFGHCRI